MNWSVRALVRPGMATGFRLTGVVADEVVTPEEAAALVAARSAEPGLGILLVEQALIDALPDDVRRELDRKPAPILVPVPSVTWGKAPTEAESIILNLLRRAIGYRVKL